MVRKSFVLPATFPGSKIGSEELKKALLHIAPFNFPVIEYYCENCDPDEAKSLLDGAEGIFLGAALQKREGLNPSSQDADVRKKAVELLTGSFQFAARSGASAVLVNSGVRPTDEREDEVCLRYLRESLCKLYEASGGVRVLLEPGDRDVEYCHLIGHTERAAAFIAELRRDIPDIGLVFDISHIAQLGEELYCAWAVAKEYCNHVHLANCVLVPESPLFGDKHPLFGVKGGVYSHETARDFYEFLKNSDALVTVGIEVICAGGDEAHFFDQMTEEMKWFFKT